MIKITAIGWQNIYKKKQNSMQERIFSIFDAYAKYYLKNYSTISENLRN